MTIEQAIAIIHQEYLCVDRDCNIEKNCGNCDLAMPSKEPILEAYNMAIKALEQEPMDVMYYPQVEGITPTLVEPCDDAVSRQAYDKGFDDGLEEGLKVGACDDCISRQDAIDLADELKDDLPDDDRLSDMVMSHNEGILEYQTKLSLLPSVTPAEKVGRWIANGETFRCSECGELACCQGRYCNECGAKMEEQS